MKRYFYILVLALVCSAANAVNYAEVTITSTNNTLVEARSQIGSLLPSDFMDVLFNGTTPRMDRVFVLLTTPSSFADYTITDPTDNVRQSGSSFEVYHKQVTLTASTNYLLSYKSDGAKYVLDRLPFDPTVKALAPIDLAEGENTKVYITGKVSGKLSAQLEKSMPFLLPSYLESCRDILVEYTISQLETAIKDAGLTDFSVTPNTEAFFHFTGEKSSRLDLYIEDLEMQVKDKQNDFLAGVVGSEIKINLMSLDSQVDRSDYTEAELAAMTATQVQALSREEIEDMSAAKIAIIYDNMADYQKDWLSYYNRYTPAQLDALSNATIHTIDSLSIVRMSIEQLQTIVKRLTAEQAENITPGQIFAILGISDFSEILQMTPSALSSAITSAFGSTAKPSIENTILNLENKTKQIIANQLTNTGLKN